MANKDKGNDVASGSEEILSKAAPSLRLCHYTKGPCRCLVVMAAICFLVFQYSPSCTMDASEHRIDDGKEAVAFIIVASFAAIALCYVLCFITLLKVLDSIYCDQQSGVREKHNNPTNQRYHAQE
eukprot:scaffold8601_cov191-Amphora_coffeaeformis.AAC.3